jgi:hypothetical protein
LLIKPNADGPPRQRETTADLQLEEIRQRTHR